ncbi:MAG: hypothetical protein ABIR56_16905 [Polaromonas sp.]
MSDLEALPSGPAAGVKSINTTWFSKPLGDGLWAFSLADQVRDTFEPLFVLAGRPLDMAVFTRLNPMGACNAT